MDWDEARRPSGGAEPVTVGQSLEQHSLDDLRQRISTLEAEIERVRAEIQRKEAHEAQASSVFKT